MLVEKRAFRMDILILTVGTTGNPIEIVDHRHKSHVPEPNQSGEIVNCPDRLNISPIQIESLIEL